MKYVFKLKKNNFISRLWIISNFKEKERALDIANIYCRSNREPKDSTRDLNAPLWKASTQSLNAVETTPREKRKQYEKKRKDQKQMVKIKAYF